MVGRVRARQLMSDAAKPLRVKRLRIPVTGDVLEAQQEGRRHGLRIVTERVVDLEAYEAYVVQTLAVDEGGRVLAQLLGGFESGGPAPMWSLSTPLEGGRGVLVSSPHHPMPRADREIAATWPGAPLSVLLSTHAEALDLLADRGVRADPVAVDTAADIAASIHELCGEPARRDPRGTARRLRDNLAAFRHEGLAPLTEQPDLDARIAAITSA